MENSLQVTFVSNIKRILFVVSVAYRIEQGPVVFKVLTKVLHDKEVVRRGVRLRFTC